ncbi:potential E3 ubiquitin-protein ligase ariadne-2-like [Argopecten irradians]|uniref:potential E3 ubiquitin-protein ligase ariadne-2-like n=1 Tax=Argopecten irradians TaxID=31199 RepID=UPI00371C26D7
MDDVTFQRLSESQVRRVSIPRTGTFIDIKSAIASALGEDKHNIDIVDKNSLLVEGSRDISDLPRPLSVVVHNSNRTPPPRLRTDEKDIVFPCETDPRCLMPCGHAITPDNLYRHCWTKLTDRATSFHCFADQSGRGEVCGAVWTFQDVIDKACVSVDEQILFESRINRNCLYCSDDIRQCPNCHVNCERQSTSNPRVVCTFCRRACQSQGQSQGHDKGQGQYEFCWFCMKPWEDMHSCTTDTVLRVLKSCKKKKIYGVSGCPSLRACPKCHALIEHSIHCKLMTCFWCKCEFCFICLNVKGPNGFSCGAYDTVCTVAPVQDLGTPGQSRVKNDSSQSCILS